MKLLIERYSDSGIQTIGDGYIIDNFNHAIYDFHTLELPWKDNEPQISCIPIGDYKVVKRWSNKYKFHFHIQDVENRSFILIHAGNFHTHTKGCILVGDDLKYLDSDDEIDVVGSKDTLEVLLKILPEKFDLTIKNR